MALKSFPVKNSSSEFLGRSYGETHAFGRKPKLLAGSFLLSRLNVNPFPGMQANSSQEDHLGFIKPNKVADEIFSLSSGEQISIQKYFLNFSLWQGAPILDTYNGKAVIDWNGEPVFAELAVLRLFQSHGWNGVWVDSYRRKYRIGLPGVAEPVELPEKQKQLIDSIRAKTGRHGGCWDVFVWKDDQLLFIELKRQKKDRIQKSQSEWLEHSLAHGLSQDNFAFVEWNN